jgi:hypothetical protein
MQDFIFDIGKYGQLFEMKRDYKLNTKYILNGNYYNIYILIPRIIVTHNHSRLSYVTARDYLMKVQWICVHLGYISKINTTSKIVIAFIKIKILISEIILLFSIIKQ